MVGRSIAQEEQGAAAAASGSAASAAGSGDTSEGTAATEGAVAATFASPNEWQPCTHVVFEAGSPFVIISDLDGRCVLLSCCPALTSHLASSHLFPPVLLLCSSSSASSFAPPGLCLSSPGLFALVLLPSSLYVSVTLLSVRRSEPIERRIISNAVGLILPTLQRSLDATYEGATVRVALGANLSLRWTRGAEPFTSLPYDLAPPPPRPLPPPAPPPLPPWSPPPASASLPPPTPPPSAQAMQQGTQRASIGSSPAPQWLLEAMGDEAHKLLELPPLQQEGASQLAAGGDMDEPQEEEEGTRPPPANASASNASAKWLAAAEAEADEEERRLMDQVAQEADPLRL